MAAPALLSPRQPTQNVTEHLPRSPRILNSQDKIGSVALPELFREKNK